MIQKIIFLLLTAICVVFTASLVKKGRVWPAIIAALVGELFVFLSFSKSQSFIDQFSCVAGGVLFIILSFNFLQGGKHAESLLLALIAAGSFFCSLSGVQSLLKTNLLEKVTGKLVEYGNKIDSYQVTMNDIQLELRKQQGEVRQQQTNIVEAQNTITKQQHKIDGQYQGIQDVQDKVQKAESRIEKQQEQVTDIQSQFNSFVSGAWVNQAIMADDTNACLAFLEKDNSQTIVLLLKYAAIPASINCLVSGPHYPQANAI